MSIISYVQAHNINELVLEHYRSKGYTVELASMSPDPFYRIITGGKSVNVAPDSFIVETDEGLVVLTKAQLRSVRGY